MVSEQKLLIEFMESYSVDAMDKGLAKYHNIRQGIRLVSTKDSKYIFTVKSESNKSLSYNVFITVSHNEADDYCDCDAKARFGSCKHVAAALIYILMGVHRMSFDEIEEIVDGGYEWDYDMDEEIIDHSTQKKSVKIIELKPTPAQTNIPGRNDEWRMISAAPSAIFYGIYAYGYPLKSTLKNVSIAATVDITNEPLVLQFTYKVNKSVSWNPQIKYDRREQFFYKCDCDENTKICTHVKAAFMSLEHQYGRDYFRRYKNYDTEKNKLLEPYGLTVNDKEAAKIEFKLDPWGNVSMKKPSWLWKTDVADNVKTLRFILDTPAGGKISRPRAAADTVIDFEIGFLLNMASQHFKTGFELEPVKVQENNKKPVVKKLSLHQKDTLPLLKGLPDDIYESLQRLTDNGVKEHLSLEGNRGVWNYVTPWGQLDDHALRSIKRYYIGIVQKLWPYLCGQEYVYILKEGSFSNNNLERAKLSPQAVTFSFAVTEDERHITISLQKEINGEVIPADNVKQYGGFLFEINNELHLPQDITDLDMLWQFENGYIKMPISGKIEAIKSVIPLLQRKYRVEMPASFKPEVIETEPVPQLLLKEMDGKFLVLQPQYVYQGFTMNYSTNPENLFLNIPGAGCHVIVRNAEKEQEFFDSLRVLHPRFEKPTLNDFFFLPFEETMKQNWFIETVARLTEKNITVMGMQELKKHRYNTNKPKWEMKAGSGIDWFDLQIEVSFGEQVVALHEIRKALLNKQNMVVLGDGTFGVLPEEWLAQYGLLLKMGEDRKDGSLRVSKLHYTLIDELHAQIDDEEILREINEKKQKLQNIGTFKKVKPGKEIKATLRPYQLSGFQWFYTLDEMGWGGCLADDMGLGKTLQTITFLQYLKTKYKGSTHLVICPTSLIYNWEDELKKFAPSLKYHIYYGLEREFSEAHFNDYDVIITSYGIIRNDLDELMKFDWHYIILDESQAIKNPEAQTNKALQLLKSKNRMILSGTPIQNNTYDLFAQFHFINPGLLGNREFFKTEFANPIDKNNDAEKTAQLRRLIYPFMLRRTKEQVAPDLPDKTETILWCEMNKEQRAVYNEYKDYYRNKLLEKIAEVGMAKAGMYVLEGLLRLRQICDSPELVKDSEVMTKKSVKINELLREIEENTGNHKMLVFSQFTEMLHLIEDKLKESNIEYVYLDGSTPADKRKEAVHTFQNEQNIRVFLISLKAGGVGLNLTAADYVYIVDPWWNPAVEQQAIDRTHRIGQSNKIFAYKMICKDTVEEKILQLQQRKKQLASDLVTEDAGFIKKLTKEDVAFLFS
jgi:non-specific serine/threonine protein kinase